MLGTQFLGNLEHKVKLVFVTKFVTDPSHFCLCLLDKKAGWPYVAARCLCGLYRRYSCYHVFAALLRPYSAVT